MTTPIVAYLIHPVVHPSREVNLKRAYAWLKFFVDLMPDIVVLAPWLPYVESLDEEKYRERGMRDGKVLAGLAGIGVGLICGPFVSTGCHMDATNLAEYGVTTVDLTPLRMTVPPEDPPNIVSLPDLRSLIALTIRRAALVKTGAWWCVTPTFRMEEK